MFLLYAKFFHHTFSLTGESVKSYLKNQIKKVMIMIMIMFCFVTLSDQCSHCP